MTSSSEKDSAKLPEKMRLNKFLAHAGVSSRRGADTMISAGRVQVNGRTEYGMGVKVDPTSDQIKLDGKLVKLGQSESATLLLNKPPGYITSRHDPEGRRTILRLIPQKYHHLYPVGRLDYVSEGLVMLTDDGDLTYRLTHPSFEHEKEYWVQIKGRIPEPALRKLRKGVMLDDGEATAQVRKLSRIPAEQRFWLDPNSDPRLTWMTFVLTEGRKRQIRRMCEAVELDIRRLVRVRIASLHIGDLRPGDWRPLTARQKRAVNAIKASAGT